MTSSARVLRYTVGTALSVYDGKVSVDLTMKPRIEWQLCRQRQWDVCSSAGVSAPMAPEPLSKDWINNLELTTHETIHRPLWANAQMGLYYYAEQDDGKFDNYRVAMSAVLIGVTGHVNFK